MLKQCTLSIYRLGRAPLGLSSISSAARGVGSRRHSGHCVPTVRSQSCYRDISNTIVEERHSILTKKLRHHPGSGVEKGVARDADGPRVTHQRVQRIQCSRHRCGAGHDASRCGLAEWNGRCFGTDESGRIVVDVHQVVRDRGGKIVSDQMVQHVYVIEGGLIRSMEIRKS